MSAMKLNGILGSPKAHKVIFSFATPAETEKITYSVNQQHLISTLQNHSWFRNGFVIKTMEKGVMYPVMHFVTMPSIQQESAAQLLHSSSLGSSYILQQGIYTEIKQFRPFPENELLEDEDNSSRAYIVIGFKTLESTFNETLEEMWKDWTGARSIYLNLPDELGLSQVSFYRKTVPKGTNMFMYILIVQCENVNKKNCWMMLDYVQRLRVEKMMGYMSAYHRVDDEINFLPPMSPLNTVGNREVNGLMPIDI